MGLLNVSHSTMTQSVIDLQEDLLKNPFYLFNDKKALPVDYYNINNNQSTLDKGLKINYDNDGKDTPFRYNLIHDMYLYGIDRVATSLESENLVFLEVKFLEMHIFYLILLLLILEIIL